MKGDAALVTGGGKRIGAAIALYLAGRGYDIALHYNRSAKEAKALTKEIGGKGVRCRLFKADFTDDLETRSLMPKVVKEFGKVNLLVNNASYFRKGPLGEHFKEHIQVNLRAPYVITADFGRLCKKGHVINIVDAKITQDRTEYFSYVLSKKALADLTLMSAANLAPKIRVNAIAPGLILPPEGRNESYLDELAAKTGLRRGDVSDVTWAVGYLLDNPGLTGKVILADETRRKAKPK